MQGVPLRYSCINHCSSSFSSICFSSCFSSNQLLGKGRRAYRRRQAGSLLSRSGSTAVSRSGSLPRAGLQPPPPSPPPLSVGVVQSRTGVRAQDMLALKGHLGNSSLSSNSSSLKVGLRGPRLRFWTAPDWSSIGLPRTGVRAQEAKRPFDASTYKDNRKRRITEGALSVRVSGLGNPKP